MGILIYSIFLRCAVAKLAAASCLTIELRTTFEHIDRLVDKILHEVEQNVERALGKPRFLHLKADRYNKPSQATSFLNKQLNC